MLVDFPEEHATLTRLIEGGQVGQIKQYFSSLLEEGSYSLGVGTFYPFGLSSPPPLPPSDPRKSYTETGYRELTSVEPTMQSLVMVACSYPQHAPAMVKYLCSTFPQHISLNQLEWCFHHLHSWSCVAPLHVACTGYNQNLKLVRVLVKLGADVNLTSRCCQVTPLHLAVASYGGDQALDIAQFLIDHGAEIDALDHNGDTPLTLMYRCYGVDQVDKILGLLISRKADINHINNVGCSALHYAALNNDHHAVKSLLSHGASPMFSLSENPSPPVPCPLYLTTFEEIAEIFTSRADCPLPCKIDSLLLIGASGSIAVDATFWKKALTLRESHGLIPVGDRRINGVKEFTSVSEFKERCNLRESTEYPLYIEHRYLTIQSLLIKERCLGSFCHLINLRDIATTMKNYGEDVTVNVKCLQLLAHSFHNTVLPHWSLGVEKYWRSRLADLNECLHVLSGKIESAYAVAGQAFNHQHIQMYAEHSIVLLEAICSSYNVALCTKTRSMYLYVELEMVIWSLIDVLVFWLSKLRKLNLTSDDSMYGCLKSVVQMLVDKCVHLTKTTLLHFLPKRFSHSDVEGDLVALYDLVLSCDGSDSVIDFVSGEGNRPIHCIAKNITKPEQVSLVVSLCESGGHFDAVDASGKTALDYLNEAGMASHLERHIPPSPRSLMCLASCAIVKKHIPYSQMDTIPPRMKRYIALHDRQCCVYSPT